MKIHSLYGKCQCCNSDVTKEPSCQNEECRLYLIELSPRRTISGRITGKMYNRNLINEALDKMNTKQTEKVMNFIQSRV